ncbi:MAG: hypothetical protein GXO71_04310 [Caldiserica bacterium]|nr:hypothetical protein [Caldisericota bacterium]
MKNVYWLVFLLIPTLVFASYLRDFKNPNRVIIDPATNSIYVSNVNGAPLARDDNGFISRITPDFKVVTLHFLDGALNDYELDAPKGMAIKEGILYVADIDTIRGYDLNKRINVQNINLAPYGAKYLVDLVFTRDGELLVSDAAANTIFKVTLGKGIIVNKFLHSPLLKGPTGLTVLPDGRLVIVSSRGSNIWEYKKGGKFHRLLEERAYYRYLEDVDYDKYGNLYFTDFSTGRIFRLDKKGRVSTFPGNFYSPRGITIDRTNNRVFIVEFSLDRVDVIDLE